MVTGTAGAVVRRLAAVAFADVVGFTAMVEADDAAAVQRWRELFEQVVAPLTAKFRGRALRTLGDSVFIEFQSVVDAALWALALQAAIVENDSFARSIQLRIGINVEDVIVDGIDLHGDGVNIAARIHALASPGEIIVTSTVRDYLHNKVDALLEDLGEHALKNLSRAIHVFRLRRPLDPGESPSRGGASSPLLGAHDPKAAFGPTLAVLPFRTLLADTQADYFGSGITEDIIAALSRDRSFAVIAHASTLAVRQPPLDVARAMNELGARYVVSGSVRRQAGQLLITAELTDAVHRHNLWTGRFEGREDDLFEFQRDIASRVSGALSPSIQVAELKRVRARPSTQRLDAYDCVLRALSLLATLDLEDFAQALTWLDRAIELDPGMARAYAWKAWWHVLALGERPSANKPAGDGAIAEEQVRRALALDPDDAFALAVAGHVHAFLRHSPRIGLHHFDRALEINPNSAFAWGVSGSTLSFLGRGAEALERLAVAHRLSPRDPMNFFYLTVAGLAWFVEGDPAAAIDRLEEALAANGRFVAAHRLLSACLGLQGRDVEARAAGQRLLEVVPGFKSREFVDFYPLQRPEDKERLLRGLLAAALPP